MQRTWAAVAAMVMTTVLRARASQAQSTPPGPAGSGAAAPGPAPTVAGNTVMIPVPSASATVAGPSAKTAAPPPMLMVPQPAGAGQVPSGYVLLVPWTPPAAGTAPTTIAPVSGSAGVERSYALTMVIPDGVALGMGFLALATSSDNTAALASTVYALGGPIIHWSRGNVSKGFASLALRVAMPLGGLYVGAIGCVASISRDLESGRSDQCEASFVIGVVAGIAGALVLDYAFLAREKVPAESTRTVRWSPTLTPSKQGMSLGLVGTW